MTASLTSSNPAGPEPHVSRRHTPLGKRLSIAMTLWLTIIWCLIFGHFDWLTIISGVLVALAVQVAFPLPHITYSPVAYPSAVRAVGAADLHARCHRGRTAGVKSRAAQ